MAKYVGSKDTDKNSAHVGQIRTKETLLINIGTIPISATVIDISGDKKDIIKFSLYPPVCVEKGETVAFSRRLGHNWRYSIIIIYYKYKIILKLILLLIKK